MKTQIKRCLPALLALLLVALFAACGSKEEPVSTAPPYTGELSNLATGLASGSQTEPPAYIDPPPTIQTIQ